MRNPLNPIEGDPKTVSDTADVQDWASPRVTSLARLMAFVILPSLFLVILVFAVWWRITHPDKPLAVVQAQPVASAPHISAVTATTNENNAQIDKDAQIAQLQSQIAALQGQTPSNSSAPYYTADSGALNRLNTRLDQIEANQRLLARAIKSAYAASALQLAAKTQTPFLSELAVVEPSLDDPQLAAHLRPFAEKGVPSEVTLAVDFPKAAARANIAAKVEADDNSVWARLKHAFGSFLSIRRTDNPNGQGTESILTRAEIRLNNGDLKGALAYLNTLSPATQKALSPWLEQARARVTVDDATRQISEAALNRLSQMSVAPSDTLDNGGTL